MGKEGGECSVMAFGGWTPLLRWPYSVPLTRIMTKAIVRPTYSRVSAVLGRKLFCFADVIDLLCIFFYFQHI